MRKRIFHVVLLLPVMLMLLHAVTPHHHDGQDAPLLFSASHQCPSGFLNDLFNVDLGENHLEEYQTSRYEANLSVDFYWVAWTIFTPVTLQDQPDSDRTFVDASVSLRQLFLSSSKSLRAPPALLV